MSTLLGKAKSKGILKSQTLVKTPNLIEFCKARPVHYIQQFAL